MSSRALRSLAAGAAGVLLLVLSLRGGLTAAGTIQPPEQFIGFRVGADNKLARWDAIVNYMNAVAAGSDRVRVRELGKTNGNNSLVLVEIGAPDALKNLDRYKQLERKLYFQDGTPTPREREEIFRQGKVVVLLTCSVHANEVGATQMTLELVHRLATDESPATRKILDNVIFLLVPSMNPDGQILVTDWFNKNLGTPFEDSPLPYLYHPYAGHDLNRDMYMLTQIESQYIARLAWRDWFPSIWMDAHQMGSTGPRMFVMPASDPINPNVHPVIYRWNTILGQSQAAALEAAGKHGIIYNSTYTNFWQGAMAWSGWWHNQIGLLTEVAQVRVAAPIFQLHAQSTATGTLSPDLRHDSRPGPLDGVPLAPPTDTMPRTEYPRPWMGGRWTLRDIVDYELIATMALLETAADRREAILRQIYEVNRQTVEERRPGDPTAILIPVDSQHDPREAAQLAQRLTMAGVDVWRADAAFDVNGRTHPSGTFVVPMTQVFARYAKDLLEKQTYPDVRKSADVSTIEQPYDVTGWSLGMLLGVVVEFATTPLPATMKRTQVSEFVAPAGVVSGNGPRFVFDYRGADTAKAINRLLKAGARLSFEDESKIAAVEVQRDVINTLAREFGLTVRAEPATRAGSPTSPAHATLNAPRVGVYSPWTGGSIDEGWTRWVLEEHEFDVRPVYNADIRAAQLKRAFDVIILPDQLPRDIVDGFTGSSIRPEYRGGIADVGVANLQRFVADGGTLVALGAASDLLIDRLPLPVRDIKRSLRRDQHFAPGSIVRLHIDVSHPLGLGLAAETYGFYSNSPFFAVEGFDASKTAIIARYPNSDVLASGWLRGEELMAGRAAVVSVDMDPGRVVLFGIRPQHRGQTRATFPLLFNALYLAASRRAAIGTAQQQ